MTRDELLKLHATLTQEAKDLKKIEKQLNAYVVKGTDGSLITVGHSYRRRRN